MFETDHYDIGFGILRYPQDKLNAGLQGKDAIEEVVDTRRVDSNKAPEDGSITCTKAGKCEAEQFVSATGIMWTISSPASSSRYYHHLYHHRHHRFVLTVIIIIVTYSRG